LLCCMWCLCWGSTNARTSHCASGELSEFASSVDYKHSGITADFPSAALTFASPVNAWHCVEGFVNPLGLHGSWLLACEAAASLLARGLKGHAEQQNASFSRRFAVRCRFVGGCRRSWSRKNLCSVVSFVSNGGGMVVQSLGRLGGIGFAHSTAQHCTHNCLPLLLPHESEAVDVQHPLEHGASRSPAKSVSIEPQSAAQCGPKKITKWSRKAQAVGAAKDAQFCEGRNMRPNSVPPPRACFLSLCFLGVTVIKKDQTSRDGRGQSGQVSVATPAAAIAAAAPLTA
jgi:hypothetical protein